MKAGIKILSAAIILLASCESNVIDVKVPEFEQKLVIAGFIAPSDSVVYINVASNKRIFGELGNAEDPGNISGTISDGTSTATFSNYSSGLMINHRQMRIEPGKTYSIEVKSDKGMSASASCTVPDMKTPLVTADTFSVVYFNGQWREEEVHIRARLTDFPGEENYYMLKPVVEYYIHDSRGNHKNSYDTGDIFLLSDRHRDGTEFVVETMPVPPILRADSVNIILRIYNLEKSYYQYHVQLKNGGGGDSPFAEPYPAFSNVSGGLGIFTSYTADSVTIRLR